MSRFTAVLLAAVLAVAASCAAAGADPAAPNDPDFANCPNKDATSSCAGSGQWDLYGPLAGSCDSGLPRPDGGLPCWAPLARDPEHSAGVNMTGAWAQGNVGRADILVAYIEGGVNYDSNNIKDGLDNVFINQRELPKPEQADGTAYGAYDANGDGRFDIRDYAHDPRVNPACPSGTAPFAKYEEGDHPLVRGRRAARLPQQGRHRRQEDRLPLARGPHRRLLRPQGRRPQRLRRRHLRLELRPQHQRSADRGHRPTGTRRA